MKHTLSLISVLLVSFVLWLGRPYQFTQNPDCTNSFFNEHSNSGPMPNCGNSSFLSRVDEHWIEFAIHGRPVMANLTMKHATNCNDRDLNLHGNNFIFYGDTINGLDGPICLDLTEGGGVK